MCDGRGRQEGVPIRSRRNSTTPLGNSKPGTAGIAPGPAVDLWRAQIEGLLPRIRLCRTVASATYAGNGTVPELCCRDNSSGRTCFDVRYAGNVGGKSEAPGDSGGVDRGFCVGRRWGLPACAVARTMGCEGNGRDFIPMRLLLASTPEKGRNSV